MGEELLLGLGRDRLGRLVFCSAGSPAWAGGVSSRAAGGVFSAVEDASTAVVGSEGPTGSSGRVEGIGGGHGGLRRGSGLL